jgi:hypothetical protein
MWDDDADDFDADEEDWVAAVVRLSMVLWRIVGREYTNGMLPLLTPGAPLAGYRWGRPRLEEAEVLEIVQGLVWERVQRYHDEWIIQEIQRRR